MSNTLCPRRASCRAVHAPNTPAPTTSTSYVLTFDTFFSCTGYKNGRRDVQYTRVQHRNASRLMRKTLPSKRPPLYHAQLAISEEVCVHAVRNQVISSVFAIALLGTFALVGYAQQKQKDHKQKDDAAASSNTTIDPKLYGAIKCRLIGPIRGGRVL